MIRSWFFGGFHQPWGTVASRIGTAHTPTRFHAVIIPAAILILAAGCATAPENDSSEATDSASALSPTLPFTSTPGRCKLGSATRQSRRHSIPMGTSSTATTMLPQTLSIASGTILPRTTRGPKAVTTWKPYSPKISVALARRAVSTVSGRTAWVFRKRRRIGSRSSGRD